MQPCMFEKYQKESFFVDLLKLTNIKNLARFLMYLQQTLTFSITSRFLGTDAFGGVSLGLLVGNLSGFMVRL